MAHRPDRQEDQTDGFPLDPTRSEDFAIGRHVSIFENR